MKSALKPYERVLARSVKQPGPAGCIEWQGYATQGGYGQIWVDGKAVYTHRVMAAHYGMRIDGAHVDHRCRNKLCVRESHLEAVSPAENNRRKDSAGWRAFIREYLEEQHMQLEWNRDVADAARLNYRRSLATEANMKHYSGQPLSADDRELHYRWLIAFVYCVGCGRDFYAPIDMTPNGHSQHLCGDCMAA
ncbi:HNH endonuclease signature motif containing protein [Actinoplanes sp. NPDC048988]|uniref:HNH endonuclease signature motif containing protein n=1 Tax=Actinoplanes sp. NPDC048988 TaxID=3363901 RepID=UPI00371E6A14